jgi:hypothetical protein
MSTATTIIGYYSHSYNRHARQLGTPAGVFDLQTVNESDLSVAAQHELTEGQLMART